LVNVNLVTRFEEWFLSMTDLCFSVDAEGKMLLHRIVSTLWYLWKGKNDFVSRGKLSNPYKTINLVHKAVDESIDAKNFLQHRILGGEHSFCSDAPMEAQRRSDSNRGNKFLCEARSNKESMRQ